MSSTVSDRCSRALNVALVHRLEKWREMVMARHVAAPEDGRPGELRRTARTRPDAFGASGGDYFAVVAALAWAMKRSMWTCGMPSNVPPIGDGRFASSIRRWASRRDTGAPGCV